MTIYLDHQIQINASLDEEKKLVSFLRAADLVTKVNRTDLTEEHQETRTIGTSVTDEALTFGGVATAKVIYMETDQALTLKINGAAVAMALTPTSGAKAKLFWEGSFTAITVTNPSSTDAANLTYYIAG
jgi:hypothetical protein